MTRVLLSSSCTRLASYGNVTYPYYQVSRRCPSTAKGNTSLHASSHIAHDPGVVSSIFPDRATRKVRRESGRYGHTRKAEATPYKVHLLGMEKESNNTTVALVKLTLVGAVGVGKTSIQMRYTLDEFDTMHRTTVGMDIQEKHITVAGRKARIDMWDSAGQERYESMTRQCLRGAHGVILVFDLTEWQTFTELNTRWLPKIEDECPEACRLLIGNKADLLTGRNLPNEEVKRFAEDNGFFYYEDSAKTGANIALAFEVFLAEVCEKHKLLGKVAFAPKNVIKLGEGQPLKPVLQSDTEELPPVQEKPSGGCDC